MAIISGKVLGSSRGKVGDIVFQKWRNLTTARVRVTPKNPMTETQVTNRLIFAAASRVAQAFAPVLYLGMKKSTAGTSLSPRNLFMKLNYPAFRGVTSPVGIDFRQLQVAKGSFRIPDFGVPSFDDTLSLEVPLVSMNMPEGVDRNLATPYLVIYNDKLNEVIFEPGSGNDSSIFRSVPSSWAGASVYVYGFSIYNGPALPEYGIEPGFVSNSILIGTGTIA